MPCLAGCDLHLFFLLLSLASNPKHSPSAVHPPRPAGWKTSLYLPKPAPDCFNNTLLVERDGSQVFFCLCFYCAFQPSLSCLRPLSNFIGEQEIKDRSCGCFCCMLEKKKRAALNLNKIQLIYTWWIFSCSKGSFYHGDTLKIYRFQLLTNTTTVNHSH